MKIIVADDHPLVQEALGHVLAQSFPDAAILPCLCLADVTATVARHRADIDLVLLDLHMPDSQGFAGLFQMLSLYPTVPVAILSATEDPGTIRRALDFGASGYIPKSLSMARMADAIRGVLGGEIWAPEHPNDGGGGGHDNAEWARRFASLSPQQMRILALVREGRLNKQIAGDLGIAEQTVKVHVSTILRKLQVGSRTQAAVAADRLAIHSPQMADRPVRPSDA
ncbi:MAG TPA: response regulator transcription factor [Aliidongia sp.]|uniref:response regulator transcription factor n=1 Tax=Aliidongia sp. TaxID=1914230 RepID=UPI002DDD7A11|nr:response regulator transcription factor [Aliidongia sp.]HEV2677322.1 response regulator transcription factor [Aliidongia sp.]